MADHLRSELTEMALAMALMHRQPTQQLLHHSDRGSPRLSRQIGRLAYPEQYAPDWELLG